jgi:hypothetical protein
MFSPRLKNKPGPRDLTRSVCCEYSSNHSINSLSKLHKFSALMDEAEADVAGLLGFSKEHRTRHTRSTPEAPQCRDQATHRYRRISPHEAAITWLGGTILLQQNE